MKLPITGSCQCGSINYALSEVPAMVYACHCKDCQKRTGSAFSMGMMVSSATLEVIGELAAWQRTSDHGHKNTRYSCKDCGNIIYGVGSLAPDVLRLQAGTLNDTKDVSPHVHMWTSSAQSWIDLSGDVPKFETQPEDPMELLYAAQRYQQSLA